MIKQHVIIAVWYSRKEKEEVKVIVIDKYFLPRQVKLAFSDKRIYLRLGLCYTFVSGSIYLHAMVKPSIFVENCYFSKAE